MLSIIFIKKLLDEGFKKALESSYFIPSAFGDRYWKDIRIIFMEGFNWCNELEVYKDYCTMQKGDNIIGQFSIEDLEDIEIVDKDNEVWIYLIKKGVDYR